MKNDSQGKFWSTWLSKLTKFVVLPIGLGITGGYLLHRYQWSQLREDFTPYRAAHIEQTNMQPPTSAFSYIATPMEVNFGEVENFKRYRTKWEVVNSGLKTLEIELSSNTCEAEFDGKPMPAKMTIPGQMMGTVTMTWIVTDSRPEFSHELVLKTNDNIEAKKTLRFQVHGTVNPALDLSPPVLDFGKLAAGETKELTARLLCYRTKSFRVDGYSFTDESVRSGFDVRITEIADLSEYKGDRPPASGLQISVTAKADALKKKEYNEGLSLQCNLPEVEGLKLGLRVDCR